jgi:hypothetical protein
LLFSVLGAAVTLGGVFTAAGVMKGKLNSAAETNAEQSKKIEERATRDELAAAVKRPDEMLELMRERVDEDRAAGGGRYKELYGILTARGERTGKLEVSREQLFKTPGKLGAAVTGGFREMKAGMKELRAALNRAGNGERRQAP